jgi:hypothetical protein
LYSQRDWSDIGSIQEEEDAAVVVVGFVVVGLAGMVGDWIVLVLCGGGGGGGGRLAVAKLTSEQHKRMIRNFSILDRLCFYLRLLVIKNIKVEIFKIKLIFTLFK